jgi:YegS/Rv2252/BmrU family lipid kinase
VGEFTQWVSDHLPEARVEFTRHKNHAIKLASLAAKGGYSKIISVGGDGTLNEVVNGVIPHPPESRPAIGIVSAGTGGDFFRLLSQKYHFPSEFSWLTHTDAKLVDAGKVTLESQEGSPFQRYFINIADAGLSGEVERRVNASKKLLGSLQYLVSGLIAAIFYRPPQVKWAGIDWEGSPPPTVFPLLLAVVANGKYFGGGMCIAPQSEPDDQSFQIMVAEKLKYLSMLRQIPHMYRKEKFRHRKIHYGVGQKVVLEALSGEIPVGIDGESFLASRATFEVVPNALKILVPTG